MLIKVNSTLYAVLTGFDINPASNGFVSAYMTRRLAMNASYVRALGGGGACWVVRTGTSPSALVEPFHSMNSACPCGQWLQVAMPYLQRLCGATVDGKWCSGCA